MWLLQIFLDLSRAADGFCKCVLVKLGKGRKREVGGVVLKRGGV